MLFFIWLGAACISTAFPRTAYAVRLSSFVGIVEDRPPSRRAAWNGGCIGRAFGFSGVWTWLNVAPRWSA